MKVKSYEEMNREVNDIWSIKDLNARHAALVARAVRSARTIRNYLERSLLRGRQNAGPNGRCLGPPTL